MNFNSQTKPLPKQPPLSQPTDSEFITRAELAQIIMSIVSHYEKRFTALEQG